MTDENSWIDDVIKKHRKELKDLQKSKNSFIEDSPNINYNQKFQTVNVNKSNNIQSTPFTFDHNTIVTDIPLSVQKTNNDNSLEEKLIRKKEKIKRLKNEIVHLKKENEELKQKESIINRQEDNKGGFEEEQYKNIIKELNNKISLLSNENGIKDKRIYQLESLKNKEIEMMNKKIKDFERIIDENSNNYINERKALTNEMEEYQNKLNEADKYIEIVNFFIQKIDNIFNVESRNIYDINELQNKFVDIENFIIKHTLGQQENNITNNSEVNNIEDKFLNDNSISNNLEQNNIDNNINTNLKVPHFQNKYLEEGFASNINNNSFQNELENNNSNTSDFKTLEERICKIESELKKKKTMQPTNHIRRNNSGTKNIGMKLTTNINTKTVRSKSSNKIPKPETKKVKKVKKTKKVPTKTNSYKTDNDNSKTDSNQMSTISNLNHNAYASATTTKRKKPQTAKIKKK